MNNKEVKIKVNTKAEKEFLVFVKKQGKKGGIVRQFASLSEEEFNLLTDAFPSLKEFVFGVKSSELDDTYEGPEFDLTALILFHIPDKELDIVELITYISIMLNKEFKNVFKREKIFYDFIQYKTGLKFYKQLKEDK